VLDELECILLSAGMNSIRFHPTALSEKTSELALRSASQKTALPARWWC
jgi:hypothetical protein